MRLCTVRLAPLPITNAIAQRASPFSMIRGRPDPVPPDQINTSPDLILPVSLHLLGGKSAQDGISLSRTALNLTIHLEGSVRSSSPSSSQLHLLNYSATVSFFSRFGVFYFTFPMYVTVTT